MATGRPGVPVGFRIGVLFTGRLVLISLKPLNITGGFLIEFAGFQRAVDQPFVPFAVEPHGRLVLCIARVGLIAAVAAGLCRHRNRLCRTTRGESVVIA